MPDPIARRAAARQSRRIIFGGVYLAAALVAGGIASALLIQERARMVVGRGIPDRPATRKEWAPAPPRPPRPADPEPAPAEELAVVPQLPPPGPAMPPVPPAPPEADPPPAVTNMVGKVLPEVPSAKPPAVPAAKLDVSPVDKYGFPVAGSKAPAGKGKAKKGEDDKRPPLGPKLDPLVDQLTGASGKRRMEAAAKLGELGPEAAPAVPYLCLALLDRFPDVAIAALKALETVTPELYEPLAVVRVDNNGTNRALAIGRIGALKEKGWPVVPFMVACVAAEAAGQPPPLQTSHTIFNGAGHAQADAACLISAIRATGCEAPATLKAFRTFAGPTCQKPAIRLAALVHLRDWADDDADRRAVVAPLVVAAFPDPMCQVTCIKMAAAYGSLCKPLLPALKRLKLAPDAGTRKLAADAVAAIEAAD